jgi:hypothetical protein
MKYFLNLIAFSISIAFFSAPTLIASADQTQDPMAALFTPEQIQSMAAEADKIKQDLSVNNPAEYQKLLQLEQKLNSMTPEEQMQFIFMDPDDQKTFIEELSKELPTTPTEPPINMPTMPEIKQELPQIGAPEEKREEIKRVVAEPSKQERALEVIDGIINGTAGSITLKDDNVSTEYPGFLRQLQILKSYVNEKRLKKWANQGKIRNWNSAYTWTEIKDKIDKLINILYKIKEPEKRTKDYKHLDELALDTGLISSLDRLKSALFEQLPLIKSDADEIPEETKLALAQIISAYIDAIYETKIIDALSKVMEKYEPIAKKSTEEEKVATQKALETSKYERQYEPTIYGGTPESASSYRYGGSTYPSYDYGASSYSSPYTSSYTPSAPSPYDFGTPTTLSDSGSYGGGGGGFSPGSRSPGTQAGGKPGEKVDDEKEAKEEKQPDESKGYTRSREKPKKNKDLEKTVSKFEENLDQAMTLIEDKDIGITKIREHMLDSKIKPSKKMLEAIAQIASTLKDAANSLSKLKGKLSDQTKDERKTAKEAYESHQKKLAKLLSDIQDIRSMESSISPLKQKVYLGKDETIKKAKAEKDDKEVIESEFEEADKPQPPLYQLQSALEELLKRYREI